MKANETYFYRKQLSILAFNRSIADAFLREFIKTLSRAPSKVSSDMLKRKLKLNFRTLVPSRYFNRCFRVEKMKYWVNARCRGEGRMKTIPLSVSTLPITPPAFYSTQTPLSWKKSNLNLQ